MALQGKLTAVAEIGGGSRLSDLAYERILETLFQKKIPAGAFLSQNDLVELLGIPVAPVRDALKVLETEGIVTIHPRSGIQFALILGLALIESLALYTLVIIFAKVK